MRKKSKVILLSCGKYDLQEIYEKMKQGLELLGGIETFLKKDERILLKPNLLKKADISQAVITHPAVVGAFGKILKEYGYEDVFLSDSCGHGSTAKNIRGTGMEEILQELEIPAIDFTEGVKVSYPEGVQAKEFILPKELLEADAVVSLAKMKTHALERITGAVKNSYGFIYGKNKAIGHTLYPNADSFARMLIDLNRKVNPRLYILDGIIAMEGNGPGAGDPVPMHVILLSEDPVALDTVFSEMVYLKPEMVPTIYHGEKMGFGNAKEEKIEIFTLDGPVSMSEMVKIYGNPEFRVDRRKVRDGYWTNLAKVLKPFQKKPYILEERCIKCGICMESCPVEGKALHFKNGKSKPPVYDTRKCIRCFCCQEMCPAKAIQVK